MSEFNGNSVPDNVKEAFKQSQAYFPTPIQELQYYNKYARWNWELQRRETWVETVDRVTDYLKELSENRLSDREYSEIRMGILNMEAMPSMRLIAMAGPAARRNNACIYNCSYQAFDSVQSLVEALHISMSGCGVGFSVEKKFVDEVPEVEVQTYKHREVFTIQDSQEGWGKALERGLDAWMAGEDISFDYSLVRPAGAVLKTKGGRASGPEPLREMLDFCRDTIMRASGRKLTTVECHDMMCEVGNAAVSGGVRRTAMISLFSWDDKEMRSCKDGMNVPIRRWNANNSVVWPDRQMTYEEIKDQMTTMMDAGRGEPGIFNRAAAIKNSPTRRVFSSDPGINPCGEINLEDNEFCNLTISVARKNDTLVDLMRKVRLATIIGTIQSMATFFPGLNSKWKENCERERLLGVDITGQMDCQVAQKAASLSLLRDEAVRVNKEYAKKLGVNQSAAVTCNKPSGNSSVLLDTSMGIHARKSPYYLRRVTIGTDSPVFKVLKEHGVPAHPNRGASEDEAISWVFSFPVRSPEGAITEDGRSALEQLDHWMINKVNWTEHNPSCTISYDKDEMPQIIDWLYKKQDWIGGLSFLPKSDIGFDWRLLPYFPVTKDEYEKHANDFPTKIDYSRLYQHERQDMTIASQEIACTSGQCDV